MYYDDYLGMTAAYFKPSPSSINGVGRLCNHRRLSVHKRNQNLIKPLVASMVFLSCIVILPEKQSNLASICEKYNSSNACKVW